MQLLVLSDHFFEFGLSHVNASGLGYDVLKQFGYFVIHGCVIDGFIQLNRTLVIVSMPYSYHKVTKIFQNIKLRCHFTARKGCQRGFGISSGGIR